MPKLTISASPSILRLKQEAEEMGVSLPALLTADLTRYREIAEAAVPELDEWEWALLGQVLANIEASRILASNDGLPSAHYIAAGIDTWADDATDDEVLRAGRLRDRIASLPPIAVAGILMRLRK